MSRLIVVIIGHTLLQLIQAARQTRVASVNEVAQSIATATSIAVNLARRREVKRQVCLFIAARLQFDELGGVVPATALQPVAAQACGWIRLADSGGVPNGALSAALALVDLGARHNVRVGIATRFVTVDRRQYVQSLHTTQLQPFRRVEPRR